MAYRPPYDLTSSMLKLIGEIGQLIGQIEGYQLLAGDLRLRRLNQIKSLQSSLAIEGNSLSEAEIQRLLNGKLVLGPRKDILEVKNAILVYEKLDDLDPHKEDDLLMCHGLLMKGLIEPAGRYRNTGVGVVDGDKVIHLAPPANRVPQLMGDLFDYLVKYDEESILKSCIFHYEFEFIHPFADGNGRMGRLWQTVILKEIYPVLAYVPFESIILQRQAGYNQALQDSQSVGSSNPFIDFMLEALKTALQVQLENKSATQTFETRIRSFSEYIGDRSFSRRDYQLYHKNISTATASREMTKAVEDGILERSGDKRNATYQYLPI